MVRPFRFEIMWLIDHRCHDVVSETWINNTTSSFAFNLSFKLKNVQSALREWNHSSFGHVGFMIKQLTEELQQVQNNLSSIE